MYANYTYTVIAGHYVAEIGGPAPKREPEPPRQREGKMPVVRSYRSCGLLSKAAKVLQDASSPWSSQVPINLHHRSNRSAGISMGYAASD